MMMNRLSIAMCLMVVIGGITFASPSEYEVGRQYRPHQDSEPNQVFFLVYILDIDEINAEDQNFAVNIFDTTSLRCPVIWTHSFALNKIVCNLVPFNKNRTRQELGLSCDFYSTTISLRYR